MTQFCGKDTETKKKGLHKFLKWNYLGVGLEWLEKADSRKGKTLDFLLTINSINRTRPTSVDSFNDSL